MDVFKLLDAALFDDAEREYQYIKTGEYPTDNILASVLGFVLEGTNRGLSSVLAFTLDGAELQNRKAGSLYPLGMNKVWLAKVRRMLEERIKEEGAEKLADEFVSRVSRVESLPARSEIGFYLGSVLCSLMENSSQPDSHYPLIDGVMRIMEQIAPVDRLRLVVFNPDLLPSARYGILSRFPDPESLLQFIGLKLNYDPAIDKPSLEGGISIEPLSDHHKVLLGSVLHTLYQGDALNQVLDKVYQSIQGVDYRLFALSAWPSWRKQSLAAQEGRFSPIDKNTLDILFNPPGAARFIDADSVIDLVSAAVEKEGMMPAGVSKKIKGSKDLIRKPQDKIVAALLLSQNYDAVAQYLAMNAAEIERENAEFAQELLKLNAPHQGPNSEKVVNTIESLSQSGRINRDLLKSIILYAFERHNSPDLAHRFLASKDPAIIEFCREAANLMRRKSFTQRFGDTFFDRVKAKSSKAMRRFVKDYDAIFPKEQRGESTPFENVAENLLHSIKNNSGNSEAFSMNTAAAALWDAPGIPSGVKDRLLQSASFASVLSLALSGRLDKKQLESVAARFNPAQQWLLRQTNLSAGFPISISKQKTMAALRNLTKPTGGISSAYSPLAFLSGLTSISMFFIKSLLWASKTSLLLGTRALTLTRGIAGGARSFVQRQKIADLQKRYAQVSRPNYTQTWRANGLKGDYGNEQRFAF